MLEEAPRKCRQMNWTLFQEPWVLPQAVRIPRLRGTRTVRRRPVLLQLKILRRQQARRRLREEAEERVQRALPEAALRQVPLDENPPASSPIRRKGRPPLEHRKRPGKHWLATSLLEPVRPRLLLQTQAPVLRRLVRARRQLPSSGLPGWLPLEVPAEQARHWLPIPRR